MLRTYMRNYPQAEDNGTEQKPTAVRQSQRLLKHPIDCVEVPEEQADVKRTRKKGGA